MCAFPGQRRHLRGRGTRASDPACHQASKPRMVEVPVDGSGCGVAVPACRPVVCHHGFLSKSGPSPHDCGGGAHHRRPGGDRQHPHRPVSRTGGGARYYGAWARGKIVSILRSEFGFHEVTLDHPVIHVGFYPDGSSNVPGPSVVRASQVSSVEKLFALSIDNFYVRHGELLWDDKTLPLEFAANDAALQMEYSFLRGRYESRLLLGKVDAKYDRFRPFAWMTDVKFTLASSFAEIDAMKLTSGRSHVEVRGLISDFRHPQISASYSAHVDFPKVASITRRQDFREGVVEFQGHGKWTVEEFSASGALEARDFGWQDARILPKKASATADYAVTDH